MAMESLSEDDVVYIPCCNSFFIEETKPKSNSSISRQRPKHFVKPRIVEQDVFQSALDCG